jgi:hypothetical protein
MAQSQDMEQVQVVKMQSHRSRSGVEPARRAVGPDGPPVDLQEAASWIAIGEPPHDPGVPAIPVRSLRAPIDARHDSDGGRPVDHAGREARARRVGEG